MEVGLTEGADTAIISGLVPDEIVVTDGIDKLKDNALVSTKEVKEPAQPEKAESGSGKGSDSDKGREGK